MTPRLLHTLKSAKVRSEQRAILVVIEFEEHSNRRNQDRGVVQHDARGYFGSPSIAGFSLKFPESQAHIGKKKPSVVTAGLLQLDRR